MENWVGNELINSGSHNIDKTDVFCYNSLKNNELMGKAPVKARFIRGSLKKI